MVAADSIFCLHEELCNWSLCRTWLALTWSCDGYVLYLPNIRSPHTLLKWLRRSLLPEVPGFATLYFSNDFLLNGLYLWSDPRTKLGRNSGDSVLLPSASMPGNSRSRNHVRLNERLKPESFRCFQSQHKCWETSRCQWAWCTKAKFLRSQRC